MYRSFRNKCARLLKSIEKSLYATKLLPASRLVLPDFLGIGAMKSGTTWLYENLRCHPEIYLPEVKEIYYFSIRFHHYWLRTYSRYFIKGQGHVKGDITPGYSIIPAKRVKFIRSIIPRAKLIFLMRNPIDRTWSEAYMNLVVKSRRKFEDVTDEEFIAYFQSKDCRKRSDYIRIIDRWLTYFPSQQLFTCFLDEIKIRHRDVLQRIFRFLEVGDNPEWDSFPSSKWVIPHYESNKMVYRGDIQGNYEPTDKFLPDKLRSVLEKMYADQMEELHRYYQAPVESWRARQ